MHFTVPDGVMPGETLKLMTPRGGEVEVEVPMDAKVGKSFAVTIPASTSSAEGAPTPQTVLFARRRKGQERKRSGSG